MTATYTPALHAAWRMVPLEIRELAMVSLPDWVREAIGGIEVRP